MCVVQYHYHRERCHGEGDRVTLTPLRQASTSLWRKAIHHPRSEQHASKQGQGPSASPRHHHRSLTLCHRGQSLQESKQETTSKALCKSGRFPFGHAENVTMQLIYLAAALLFTRCFSFDPSSSTTHDTWTC